jgi:hypothetical protein
MISLTELILTKLSLKAAKEILKEKKQVGLPIKKRIQFIKIDPNQINKTLDFVKNGVIFSDIFNESDLNILIDLYEKIKEYEDIKILDSDPLKKWETETLQERKEISKYIINNKIFTILYNSLLNYCDYTEFGIYDKILGLMFVIRNWIQEYFVPEDINFFSTEDAKFFIFAYFEDYKFNKEIIYNTVLQNVNIENWNKEDSAINTMDQLQKIIFLQKKNTEKYLRLLYDQLQLISLKIKNINAIEAPEGFIELEEEKAVTLELEEEKIVTLELKKEKDVTLPKKSKNIYIWISLLAIIVISIVILYINKEKIKKIQFQAIAKKQ